MFYKQKFNDDNDDATTWHDDYIYTYIFIYDDLYNKVLLGFTVMVWT